MKRFSYLVSVIVFCLAFVCARPAAAQDPLVVNSKTVRMKMENERVRVLEAALKPGDKEQPHSHPAYATYVLAGGTVRMHYPDGTTRDATLSAGDVIWSDPTTHWAENIGTTEMRFILVELKK